MWVIPYLMGPAGSAASRTGVMVTDSAYVVASMHIMTRVGQVAFDNMRARRRLHRGPPRHGRPLAGPAAHPPLPRGEAHLERGLGLRRQRAARQEVPRPPHRVGPGAAGRLDGRAHVHPRRGGSRGSHHLLRRRPCRAPPGKTNLAMVVSKLPGYRAWTLGDDIAWIYVDAEGQLRAINPERGFFGVAPNTQREPPIRTASRWCGPNTIFTNVAMTPAKEPWWEGIGSEAPAGTLDWQGRPWTPGGRPAAHPNSRFTVPCSQCPSIAPNWEDPQGVPISGFIFGSRRTNVIPHGLRELRLAARRVPRRGHEHGDHRGHHRPGRRGASRSRWP